MLFSWVCIFFLNEICTVRATDQDRGNTSKQSLVARNFQRLPLSINNYNSFYRVGRNKKVKKLLLDITKQLHALESQVGLLMTKNDSNKGTYIRTYNRDHIIEQYTVRL